MVNVRSGMRTFVAVALVAAALLPWLRLGGRWPVAVGALVDHCNVPVCDFAKIYLPQSRALYAAPGELHPKWFYPPLLAILLQPVAFLRDTHALHVWIGLQLGGVAALTGVCVHYLRRRLVGWAAVAAAVGFVTVCLPVLSAVKWGQVSIFLVLLSWIGLVGARRGSGLMLGLAGAIKVYPLLFLLGVSGPNRLRRVTEAVGACVVFGVLLPFLMLGADAVPFFEVVLHPAVGHRGAELGGQSVWAACVRWFSDGRHVGLVEDAAPMIWPAGATAAAGAAAVLSVAAVVGVVKRLKAGVSQMHGALLIFTCIALLLSPGWSHYFCFLPLCWAYVVGRRDFLSVEGVLSLAAWGVTALPTLLLTDGAGVSFMYSALGGTTVAGLLTLYALVRLPADDVGAETQT